MRNRAMSGTAVQVRLFKGRKKLAQSGIYFTGPRVLRPGQRAVWSVYVPKAPASWSSTVVVTGTAKGAPDNARTLDPSVEPEGVGVEDRRFMGDGPTGGGYHQVVVTGVVKNLGTVPARGVSLTGALYDPSGRFVDVARGLELWRNGAKVQRLAAGQSAQIRGHFPRTDLSGLRYSPDWRVVVYVEALKGG